MDKFFATVSKYIIYIPIAIIVLALLFKFNQTSKTIGKMVDRITPTPTTTPKQTNVDLTGPYFCSYKNELVEYTAYIKNKKILVNVVTKTDTDKYFFDGDCFFADGVKKTCGLSSYVSLLEGAIAGNLSMINNLAKDYLEGGVEVGEILKTCKKQDFKDTVFE